MAEDNAQLLEGLRKILEQGSLSRVGEEVEQALKGLEKVINKGTVETRRQTAAQEKTQRATQVISKSYDKRLGQFTNDFKTHSTLMSKAFEDSVQTLRYEATEKLPQYFRDVVDAGQSTILKGFVDQMTSMQDVDETVARMTALNEIVDAAREGQISQNEAVARGKILLERFGVEVRETDDVMGMLAQASDEAKESLMLMADSARGGVFADVRDKSIALANVFGRVAAVYWAASQAFMSVTKPALQMGTEVLDSYQAFVAGMNPEEFAQIQAQYRQQIGAANITLDEFQNTIIEGATELTAFTGSLRESVRIQADAFQTARRFGVDGQEATKSFIAGQRALFQEFNTVFSMTAEDFIQMNEAIKESTAVQQRIYRLNRQQRVLYIEQYQQTVRQLKINGLQQEAAMAAADAMAALGAESPKERLKRAAKLQAVGGALGMGAESAEMADMMRRGDTANARFAELMTGMQRRTGDIMGQGFGQEMMVSQMLETTGLDSVLGPKSDFARLNTQQYEVIVDLEKSAVKREKWQGQTVAAINRLNNLIAGPIGAQVGLMVTGITAMAGFMAARSAFGAMGAGMGVGSILSKAVPILAGASVIATIGGAAWAYFKNKGDEETRAAQTDPALIKEREKYLESQRMDALRTIAGITKKTGVQAGLGTESSMIWGKRYVDASTGEKYQVGTFDDMSTRDRTSIRINNALQKMQDQQAKLGLEQANRGTTEHEEMIDYIQEQIEALNGIKERINDPDKAVVNKLDEIKTQDQEQYNKENKKSKNTRLIWTPAAGS